MMRFRYFGKVPLCNHRAERGIFIHGFCLPLCARCTGILLGAFAGSLFIHLPSVAGSWKNVPTDLRFPAGLAMIVPTAIDGAAQNIFGIESTNRRRIVTGLAAGAGCAVVEETVLRWIL